MTRDITIGLAAIAILLTACNERVESSYRDVEAAVAGGAFRRGWVPVALPTSSHHILEVHDLDTNEVWGRFQYDPSTSAGDEAREISLETLVLPRMPGVEWWPDRFSKGKGPSEDARAFRSYDDGGVAFIVLEADEGFFWRPSS